MTSAKSKGGKMTTMIWIVGLAVVVIAIGAAIGWKWLVPGGNDYQGLPWSEAFGSLHNQVSASYPFTEWKGIDWDALYALTAPRIVQAEANGDVEAYYMALREYAYSIPDGHVTLGGEDFGLRAQAIGGGYGLGIVELVDGRVIAHLLLDDGPAARAGMAWGAEILTWNGQPIAEAVAQTETLWAITPQPTEEGRRLEQYRYLVRDPVGTEINLSYQNRGEAAPQTVGLVAQDDGLEMLTRTLPPERQGLATMFSAPIQAEVLPCGYGYVSIHGFMPTPGGLRPAKIMDRAIESFVAQEVPGIIIDVRSNGGGLDSLVPELVGHFYETPAFYEFVAYHDAGSGQFHINPAETLTIEPRPVPYGGPVLVLVDKGTVSTAEGLPLVLQRLPKGRVVGLYGSHGSFAVGTPGRNLYRLPEGVAFVFLEGRSLDANQVIQVDANAEGVGGVVPDVRVPLTEETAYAMYVEGRDIVLEAAIDALARME